MWIIQHNIIIINERERWKRELSEKGKRESWYCSCKIIATNILIITAPAFIMGRRKIVTCLKEREFVKLIVTNWVANCKLLVKLINSLFPYHHGPRPATGTDNPPYPHMPSFCWSGYTDYFHNRFALERPGEESHESHEWITQLIWLRVSDRFSWFTIARVTYQYENNEASTTMTAAREVAIVVFLQLVKDITFN